MVLLCGAILLIIELAPFVEDEAVSQLQINT